MTLSLTVGGHPGRQSHEAPGRALRGDRLSSSEQWSLRLDEALAGEYRHGMATLQTGEMLSGLENCESGTWRAGAKRSLRAPKPCRFSFVTEV